MGEILVFRSGDQVRVHSKIKEGGKTRTQVFSGIVIYKRGKGENKTFCVRRLSKDGVFVERIFPLPSPLIEKVEVVKKGKVRRAKLYYLRKKEFAKAKSS
jgi:large subunit ribosomal protein L19